MKVIKPYFEILGTVDGKEILKSIEVCGRTCYKSENLITGDSAVEFVKNILKRGHESVIEHEKVTVRIICDRGVSHEIVRHRIASYSQESTRYCNYQKDKFGHELTFIKPIFWDESCSEYTIWYNMMQNIEEKYMQLINLGASPQEARSILPNSLKTEIVVTMNLREWRHFFKLRTSEAAHPQMREIAEKMLDEFIKLIPIVFDDIKS
ncbi:MAG: FAD-dependent thymidylate synthase [Lachnospiraceae bacterium]|nr:FAD-dependent thymidylate synthase [Lachnospiraceae bacterium]